MGIIETLKGWYETDASPEEKARLEGLRNPEGGLLAALNAVTFTGPQMRDAVAAIQKVLGRTEADAFRQGLALSAFVSEAGIGPEDYAVPALHARVIAMDAWCNACDPFGQTDVDAFFEAAGRQPLLQTNEGMRFDPVAFRELIAFISELPF